MLFRRQNNLPTPRLFSPCVRTISPENVFLMLVHSFASVLTRLLPEREHPKGERKGWQGKMRVQRIEKPAQTLRSDLTLQRPSLIRACQKPVIITPVWTSNLKHAASEEEKSIREYADSTSTSCFYSGIGVKSYSLQQNTMCPIESLRQLFLSQL